MTEEIGGVSFTAAELLRSSGPPQFFDPKLEAQYRTSLVMRSSDSIATIFNRIAAVCTVVLLALFALAAFGSVHINPILVVYLSVVVLSMHLTAKTATSPQFISFPGFAETLVSIMSVIAMTGSIFVLVPGSYSNEEFLSCDNQASSDNASVKKARVEIYSAFLGGCLPLSGLLLMQLNVVHYKSFRRILGMLVGCHALRALVLTPVEAPLLWVTLNYIIVPSVILVSAKTKELGNRKLFLLNLKLKSDLIAAEKALRYEAPTKTEVQLVKRFRDSKNSLRDLELPFESLELFEALGGGAFGEVIKGQYGETLVAVKRLRRSQMNEECLRMLLLEATLLRDMRHPNIVQLVGVSWDSAANVCVVLEYMERGSLGHVLADKQISLSWSDPMLKMMTGVASGIHYMHTRPKPVIHRDMKPDNVLVTSTYGCKITDLGASRRVEHPDSETMTQIGTEMYIAPEVVQGHRYNASVDIYALGIMLVAVHTREKPFKRQRRGLLFMAIVQGLRPYIPDNLPQGLASLARDCWQEDPEQRPSSSEVVARLKRVEEEGDMV